MVLKALEELLGGQLWVLHWQVEGSEPAEGWGCTPSNSRLAPAEFPVPHHTIPVYTLGCSGLLWGIPMFDVHQAPLAAWSQIPWHIATRPLCAFSFSRESPYQCPPGPTSDQGSGPAHMFPMVLCIVATADSYTLPVSQETFRSCWWGWAGGWHQAARWGCYHTQILPWLHYDVQKEYK